MKISDGPKKRDFCAIAQTPVPIISECSPSACTQMCLQWDYLLLLNGILKASQFCVFDCERSVGEGVLKLVIRKELGYLTKELAYRISCAIVRGKILEQFFCFKIQKLNGKNH